MLEAVGLGAHVDKRPHQLSGGQRQRVAIARALVGNPAIVLADEPTASLDKASGREVVDRMQSLAKEQGATILIVTHDNRILDVADRILHLEDGRISTFTEAVIANTQQMMGLLAESASREPLEQRVAQMDEAAFRSTLQELTRQSQQFLEATALARDRAHRSLLEQALRVSRGAWPSCSMLSGRPCSSWIRGAESDATVSRTWRPDELRIPIGSGIAGAAAASGRPVRVADAYQDPRFNRNVDLQTGFRTRSVLCLPLHDRSGNVFAVTQLLNRRDGLPFDEADESRYADFAGSLGLLLESLVAMGGGPTA